MHRDLRLSRQYVPGNQGPRALPRFHINDVEEMGLDESKHGVAAYEVSAAKLDSKV